MRVRAGTVRELREQGCLLTKAGAHAVCVFWHDDRPYALDDRCPHMGFPLHRGSVEAGLVTCHWHHARFDLESGGTLDPFADDARSYPVSIENGDVFIEDATARDDPAHLEARIAEGLEQQLTLVTAKAVVGLLESEEPAAGVVRTGVEFGTRYRRPGWGAGLTVLVAMANLLPQLDPEDRALALVHGLSFVARDTANHAPRFPLAPLTTHALDPDRLTVWYRRFIGTRSVDAAERTLASAIASGESPDAVARMMVAAATDHVFLDGGHTIDFTNKALEALDHIGWENAPSVLPTLVGETARASRAEEGGEWRHPHDLVGLISRFEERIPALLAKGAAEANGVDIDVGALAHELLVDDPEHVEHSLEAAVADGASVEGVARALAFAAALRVTRFHIQNDHGDWDVVHHGFTAANAVHQLAARHPSPEILRAVVHGALKVYLDRFLNVPAARLPTSDHGDLDELRACWDEQGAVDRAGSIVYGYLRAGGDPGRAVAALGHALLAEDAEFHWFQTVEAAVRQFRAWPAGSEEAALILVGAARFLAAHTPTRRELPQVVRIATRLRRGENLFEES